MPWVQTHMVSWVPGRAGGDKKIRHSWCGIDLLTASVPDSPLPLFFAEAFVPSGTDRGLTNGPGQLGSPEAGFRGVTNRGQLRLPMPKILPHLVGFG